LRGIDLGMSSLNATGVREHAHPYLKQLRQRTSHAASLGVLDGSDVVYVDHLRSSSPRQSRRELDLRVGSQRPAHASAMGKLLLAHLRDPEQRELTVEMKLTKRTPNTITLKRALREQLNEIHAAGLAIDNRELDAELYGIAAPVRNESREVIAAVGLTAHTANITLEELVDTFGPRVVSTTGNIAARLGYRHYREGTS
jgi:IclR family transcriptional regulator, pca regulon regulatory protein